MLESFRNLPPVARIIVVALGISVLAGIALLIPLFLTQNNGENKADDVRSANTDPVTSLPSNIPRTDGPVVASPQPTFQYTEDPKPTPVPESSDQPQKIKSDLSTKVIENSYSAIKKGVLAYCTYPKGEDNEARQKRLAPYFASNSDLARNNNDFITQQRCQVLNGYLQNSDGKNGLYYNYYLSVATQYLQEDLSTDNTTADLKDYGYAVHAAYVNGKWLIDKIDIQ